PHLEAAAVQAIFTPRALQTDPQKLAIERSNELAAELLASDILLLSMPMWNFGVPSAIKAWIDHVVRAGITFNYTPAGVQGHAEKTRAIVVAASGAVFSDGPMSAWDHLVPYVTHVLGFIGIKDIQVVRLEGTISAPQDALANAQKAIQGLTL
ncbi:MAG: NAD(P)H-dependent oxidoreductase, partial [Polyangiaceae bacterium]